jgi:hypothetical protein
MMPYYGALLGAKPAIQIAHVRAFTSARIAFQHQQGTLGTLKYSKKIIVKLTIRNYEI